MVVHDEVGMRAANPNNNEEMTEPETDYIENNLGNAAHPMLSSFCRKLERERDEAREQRDRLAEALQRVRDGYGGQAVDPACGCDDCAYLRPIDAALQSLTPNKPLCFGLPKCDNCGYEFDQDLLGKYGYPNCENDRDHDIGDDPNYQ